MPRRITARTGLYAVIGSPIGHSLSPIMHNYLFERYGIDAVYVALEVSLSDLGHFVALARSNFKGFNVTVPLKEEVLRYVDEASGVVREVGAANTVKNNNGKLVAHNTDVEALVEVLCGVANGSRALVLGAGGAGRAAVYALWKCGAEVTIMNRTHERALTLTQWFNTLGAQVKAMKWDPRASVNFDIVINATTVGMKKGESPLDKHSLKPNQLIIDLVYRPGEKTELVKAAEETGCKVIDGLSILILQGIKSFKIWTGIEVDKAITTEIISILH